MIYESLELHQTILSIWLRECMISPTTENLDLENRVCVGVVQGDLEQ